MKELLLNKLKNEPLSKWWEKSKFDQGNQGKNQEKNDDLPPEGSFIGISVKQEISQPDSNDKGDEQS